MVTQLKKPFTRRIGRMVVRVHEWGIEIRGYRRRRWKRATWEQIASLAATALAMAAAVWWGGEKKSGRPR